MQTVAYSKYMYCAVAVDIWQKIKNRAFIYFSTQYMKIILQKKSRKTTDIRNIGHTRCFLSPPENWFV